MAENIRLFDSSEGDLQRPLQGLASVRESAAHSPRDGEIVLPAGQSSGSAHTGSGATTPGDDHHDTPADDRAPGANLASPAPVPTPALDYISESLRVLAVPIAELRPLARNPRAHSERDIAALVESLRRFGQQKAVVARVGTREVVAGNGTLAAARRLGWSHLAVAWFAGDDEQARAFAVIDNRTAELSAWRIGQLAQDVADIDLSGWFTERELSDLLAQLGTDAPSLDFAPVDADEQGRLDALAPRVAVTCPSCGCSFTPERS